MSMPHDDPSTQESLLVRLLRERNELCQAVLELCDTVKDLRGDLERLSHRHEALEAHMSLAVIGQPGTVPGFPQ